MQRIDGKLYVSLLHWGMFPVDDVKWEAESDNWREIPHQLDMARAARMLRKMLALKRCANYVG